MGEPGIVFPLAVTVLGVAVAAIIQNLQGSAEKREQWREACRHEEREAVKRREEREQYEEARRVERERFYAGDHRIKPDGWKAEGNVVPIEESEHKRLMERGGW